MFAGMLLCTTQRILLLSMPMPKATVAQHTLAEPLRKACRERVRASGVMPAW